MISSACYLRGAPWDRCNVLSLAKLAPRAPDATEPLLLIKSAAVPESQPDWPRLAKYRDLQSFDVQGAPWGRCDVLSLAKLAPRAPDAPEPLLL